MFAVIVLMSQETQYSTALCINIEMITILVMNVTSEIEYQTLTKERLLEPEGYAPQLKCVLIPVGLWM